MTTSGAPIQGPEDLERPVRIGLDAYISERYARAEQDRLWRRTRLQAGRIEDIPEVGDFITYDILSDSVLIVRSSPGTVQAFYNVCPHRGRRLVDTPPGQRNARGKRGTFVCGFHAWTFDLAGGCTYVPDRENWQGELDDEDIRLGSVRCDAWGGWIWITMAADAPDLLTYLDPMAPLLDPYQLQNMRCRWRKWVVFDCNWKVALEAFNETYHVAGTHPEFMAFSDFPGWARNQGLHSNIGYDAPADMDEQQGKLRIGIGEDTRRSTAEMQKYTWEAANTNTTQTMVDVAQGLMDDLPPSTPPAEVLGFWIGKSKQIDADRGVAWPEVPPGHATVAGTSWQVFPNFQIGQAVNNRLCYQARPFDFDPDKCIFEGSVYELYAQGEEPLTEWEYTEPKDWPYVLRQDFANMAAVQQGMKSRGFQGPRPNPYRERAIASLHFNLSMFMDEEPPRRLG